MTALLVCASLARGQRTEATVDVGGIALRYADTVKAGAASVSGHVLFDWNKGTGDASGTFSQFTSGGSTAQGALSGSFFSSTVRGILAEVGGFAGGSAHHDGTRTGEVLGNLRLHVLREFGEVFGGVGVGRTSFNNASQNLVLGEIGASTRIRAIDATFNFSPVALDSVRYADTQLSLSLSRRDIDFDALAGARFGDQLAGLGATARAWASLSAIAWIKPHLAAVLSGGTYPIDPTQGFPGGRYVSASIRLARRNARENPPSAPPAPQVSAGPESAPLVERFTREKSADGVTLRANAPLALSVEVTGDFTNWAPVSLSAVQGGWWSITLPLKPGNYQMNLRINGGNWLVPPGLLSMVDEFGGSVGLLVVE